MTLFTTIDKAGTRPVCTSPAAVPLRCARRAGVGDDDAGRRRGRFVCEWDLRYEGIGQGGASERAWFAHLARGRATSAGGP